ncbi:unnamed protein product [Nezara viridula]|uniref:PEHE domain-containing protein n=1 Tax=Nezara viridula TaxID=85310 RepID=A0A9P0H2D0_NEZVI|nr:unnamed protein product [Nezara viridula]
MGLRFASLRHSNVVMAPALTETVQSQSFKFATSPSRSPSLSLKNHQKKTEIISEELEPKLTNGLKFIAGMNGHSPSNNKTTYSINGLAKNLKNEFLPLNRKKDVIKDEAGSRADSNYSITQIGGYMMNSGFMGDPDMGLRKSNKELNDGDKVSPDVDQFIKNLSVVMNSEELGTNPELNQNVEEIFKVISNLDNNTSELVSGPSGENEPMFSDMGGLTNFERDLFNEVDMMNMCVDESLVTVNKDALIRERIEEFRKRKFLLLRRIEFLVRRLKKTKAHLLGRHASEEITGVLEYSSNILEASTRLRVYSSGDSDKNVKCDVKPVSFAGLSLFMRQMDHAVNQQTNTVARNSIRQCKYFGSGSSSSSLVTTSNGVRSSLPGSILPSFPSDVKQELSTTYGELHSQLVKLQQDIDSDVTESSSGCESCDEFIAYNNVHQHPLSISKRASWKWAEERALIAAKWTWLQSQIADLEYRIRQHTDIRRQVRSSKGSLKFQEEQTSHNLPNGCNSEKGEGSCSRTRGLVSSSFGKRRILQLSGLHRTSKKAARNAGLRCSCNTSLPGCGLCTSRSEPGQPAEPLSTLPVSQRVAYLDPGFHPVLSFAHDVSASVHYNAVMKCSDWQNRASRIQGKPSVPGEEKSRGGRPAGNNEHHVVDLQRSKAAALAVSVKLRRKIVRGRRRRRNASLNLEGFRQRRKHSTGLSSIDSEEGLEQDAEQGGSVRYPSPSPSPATTQHTATPISKDKETIKRKRENSYDIDNIVIPYSMASATRLEKLNYKEILTPKWRRIIKMERRDSNSDQKNGIIRRSSHDIEGEEDISDEAAIARHERCEVDEKKKFLSYLKLPNSGMGRGRGQRRTDSRADSSGPNTPDGMSPREDNTAVAEESLASPPPTPSEIETGRKRTISSSQPPQLPEVSPYEPRVFPLSDETYRKMLEESKESQHYPVTNSTLEENPPAPRSPGSVSTDSADSFLGEDPNDPEWTTVDRSNCKR